MNCEQVAGFLIPRPCANMAVTICGVCGKNVCTMHTGTSGDGSLICTSCAAQTGQGTDADEEQMRGYYGYNQTVFHTHGVTTPVYTQTDYQAFGGGSGSGAGAGGTWEPDTDLVADIDGS
jgi:hypothetical protein